MVVTALVMAGGKGLRMALREEKSLLRLNNKTMIERIISALEDTKEVDEIVVAVSRHTPKTAEFVKTFPIKILETPGNGYVSDLRYAVRKLDMDTVLTISADLPLVTADILDEIVKRYRQCGKPALTVAVPIATRERLGLKGGYVLEVGDRRLVAAGINVIDGKKIDEGHLEEEVSILDKEEVALNVNVLHDLKVAKHMLCECKPLSR
jgi:adenosylcobinamide-phosphate guanylyltransferase